MANVAFEEDVLTRAIKKGKMLRAVTATVAGTLRLESAYTLKAKKAEVFSR